MTDMEISEIVTRDRLLHRAREIAGRIAKLPPLTASYTRVALTQKLAWSEQSGRRGPQHRAGSDRQHAVEGGETDQQTGGAGAGA